MVRMRVPSVDRISSAFTEKRERLGAMVAGIYAMVGVLGFGGAGCAA